MAVTVLNRGSVAVALPPLLKILFLLIVSLVVQELSASDVVAVLNTTSPLLSSA